MTAPYTGGCQCGDIRYEITGAPKKVIACHCSICQRQSGSAFSMSLYVEEGHFRLVQGKIETWSWVPEAGSNKLRAFCPRCATRIYHKSGRRPNIISVKPGTLDDTRWLEPEVHIWTRSKQPWVVIPEGVESHETEPT